MQDDKKESLPLYPLPVRTGRRAFIGGVIILAIFILVTGAFFIPVVGPFVLAAVLAGAKFLASLALGTAAPLVLPFLAGGTATALVLPFLTGGMAAAFTAGVTVLVNLSITARINLKNRKKTDNATLPTVIKLENTPEPSSSHAKPLLLLRLGQEKFSPEMEDAVHRHMPRGYYILDQFHADSPELKYRGEDYEEQITIPCDYDELGAMDQYFSPFDGTKETLCVATFAAERFLNPLRPSSPLKNR